MRPLPPIPPHQPHERQADAASLGSAGLSATMIVATETKIFFDGGCRPNPGAMEAAVVAKGSLYHRIGLGNGSSEEAEWLALLYALEVAANLKLRQILLLGDAAGVIAQVTGTAKCRRFPNHLTQFRLETGRFACVRVRHVRRAQNLAGIALGQIHEGMGRSE